MEILDALLFAAELAQAHKAVARHNAATVATMRPRAMRGLTDSVLKCFMVPLLISTFNNVKAMVMKLPTRHFIKS
ncbi:hypothetical protein [uncultured Slackia sp.]|uniref:hypothetical protein n=1 Tax=uncultured Slackia sp. TaxID=665903 RepID=UPI002583DA22|nr:hypothetical protein [uncultured Slackia sp.]